MRRRFLICAVAAILGVFAAQACALADDKIVVNPPNDIYLKLQSDPQGAINAARSLIAAGKMDEAITHLETYVESHPYELAPHRFLGDLYVRSGQLDRAKFVYLQILALAPYDKETHNRLGTVYAVQNQIDAAIAQFSAALPGTDSVDDLVALHKKRGDLGAYRSEIEGLARDNPSDSGIQSELGQVYSALGQPEAATVYFKRSLDDDPQNLTALNGLGLAYLDLHNYGDAEVQFKHCLQVDEEQYSCVDNLGATQLESGDLAAAKATLDRAYKLAPERAETFVNYGYLADVQGDWHEAVTQYARAIGMWPYLREAYIDIALVYEEHHLYSLAQEALVKGMASVNDDGRMHALLGQAYELQGDRADALAQFKLAAAGSDPSAERIG